ncbi:methyl-accepting chemotaxis protein [Sinanaerobacter chloroacetimidivorans]|uniref:PAS domain-containing protein n=1 Tax=Sinanaerobacter chloroacetimidivorans TaxID=2818044 RepID=A0A8J7W289_9FIRM|nr:methyl-accepting chemotaxis protein [Sinanaerobacter chloroacetimidivorans]MBR0597560.1 PAS domain-containing protein [Sinanaerobacter chloroacetimidivorans]
MDSTIKKLRLGKRIKGGFNRVTFVIILMMVICIVSNIILVSYARGLYDGPYKEMKLVGEIGVQLEYLQRNIYTGIAEDDPTLITNAVNRLDGIVTDLNDKVQELKTIVPEKELYDINVFQRQIESTKPILERISTHLITFDENNDNEYVKALIIMRNEVIPIFSNAELTLNVLNKRAEQAAADYLDNAMKAQILVVSLMVVCLLIVIGVSAKISKRLEKEILTPVNELVEVSTKLANGDLDIEITYDKQNELGVLSASMRGIVASLRDLIDEANALTMGAIEGKLDTRGNADHFQGGYRQIILGVNNTLDALTGPLNTSAIYLDQISKGYIPEKITEEYNGDFNDIKNSLNTCIDAVNNLISDTNMLVTAAVYGKLNTRADSSTHGGDFAKIIEGVNKTFDILVGHTSILPSPVVIMDKEYNVLYSNKIAAELAGMSVDEFIGTKFYESFQTDDCNEQNYTLLEKLMEGEQLNGDTVAHVNGRDLEISYTALPIRNEEQEIIGALELMVDQTEIKKAMREAEKNAAIAKKQAAYQDREVESLIVNLEKLANGDLNIETSVNETDEDTAGIGENFENINENLNKSVKAIRNLADDARIMITRAVEGDLRSRADETKHSGEYAEIMKGFNATLDAVIAPIEDALAVLMEMESGNLHARMEGEYLGDYKIIKDTMNETISNILDYISEISAVLTEIGDRNLNVHITADYRGDFVTIKDSLNSIILSLSEVLGDINNAAEQVTSGSRQVSDGSQTLSQGSTQQASAIEELTASITEIASQTKQNAVNANEASSLALHVKDNAAQGNDQMKEMLNAMEEINQSSSNISKIIKVIDDIAFQTNILALNAAVEAARAGQHGKGFAVVAEEVRSLAARSAEAARNTTDLIEGSIGKVQTGTRIANDTATALNEIVAGIEKAADLVGNIATASNEQASGIALINRGIEQVSQVVQNNSATAEESAAASEELSSQAELLKEMVGKFELFQGFNTLTGDAPRLLNPADQETEPEKDSESEKDQEPEAGTQDAPKILVNDEEMDKY